MTLVVSRRAVFVIATGELKYLAPAHLAPTDPDLSWVDLPEGFTDDLFAWDVAARAMVEDVHALRSRAWSAVKARRDQAEWAGCATALGRVDTDPDSQRKVSGSVQMAMIAQAAGAPFSIEWTMQDNSSVDHDAPAMILMGVAVGQHVAICHAIAVAKRAEIEAAVDAAAIGAVDVEGGWPGAA